MELLPACVCACKSLRYLAGVNTTTTEAVQAGIVVPERRSTCAVVDSSLRFGGGVVAYCLTMMICCWLCSCARVDPLLSAAEKVLPTFFLTKSSTVV
jgi:hypothetical protein